jgi:lipopolysaccharide/colanic/teichoic acid biosynthesis glycosyltransferase
MAFISDGAKRLFDVVFSLLGLLLIAPVLLLIGVLVTLASPGPILYRGVRVGRNGKAFRILKFRTMVVDAELRGGSATAEDDPRLTSIGKFLRRYKLDELPQLVNVLKGDMSFVGPRPEVQKYVDRYSREEKAILKLRPGITDWASIWNSNEAAVLEGSSDPERTYEELILPTKVALQLKYLKNHSCFTDLKILFHTFAKLVHEDWVPKELESYGKVRRYRVVVSETST